MWRLYWTNRQNVTTELDNQTECDDCIGQTDRMWQLNWTNRQNVTTELDKQAECDNCIGQTDRMWQLNWTHMERQNYVNLFIVVMNIIKVKTHFKLRLNKLTDFFSKYVVWTWTYADQKITKTVLWNILTTTRTFDIGLLVSVFSWPYTGRMSYEQLYKQSRVSGQKSVHTSNSKPSTCAVFRVINIRKSCTDVV